MKKFTHFFFLCATVIAGNAYSQVLLNQTLPEAKESTFPFKKVEQTSIEIVPNWKFISKKPNLPAYVPGEIYVKFKESSEELKQIAVDKNGQISFRSLPFLKDIFSKYNVEEFYHSFVGAESSFLQSSFRMKIAEDSKINQVIRELSAKNYIETVVKVPLFKVLLAPNDPYYNLTTSGGLTINWNWHLDKINAEAAWDIHTGSSAIKVAIVDNAVYTSHPDLSTKIVAQYDVADNDGNANPPANVADQDDEYAWSHGTHAAGLAGAISNNNVGIASIGYNVSIIGIKCTKNSDSPLGLSAGYEGITRAADLGAHVINMSFGGPMTGQAELNYGQSIINYAYNKGCVLVAAAGNDGTQTTSYPANFNHVIAVGSTNSTDKKSSFSQYGTWVDVMAPGGYLPFQTYEEGAVNVLSTTYNVCYGLKTTFGGANFAFASSRYDGMQGTSMASPIVAGLAGLIKSANTSLSADDITNCILSTADNINSANSSYIGRIGSGRINAKAALECAVGTTPTNPNNPGNATGCDTVNLAKVQNSTWTGAAYTYSTSNYILGVNQYNDKEVFQYFNLAGSSYSTVSGAIIGLTATTITGSSKTVKISVYSSNSGLPGTVLGSAVFQAPSITQASAYLIFSFPNSIALPTNQQFFIGFDFSALSYSSGDRLGIISNSQNQTTPSDVYVKESSNNVLNLDATMQSPANISSYIFPMVSAAPSATITASASNIACNTNVTFQASNISNVASYAWSFANGTPTSATTQNASSTYTSNGTHSVTLVVKNSCGADKSITSSVTVTGCNSNPGIGISEEETINPVSSYYAPISNEFVIDFNLQQQQEFSFRIINALGQVLYTGQVNVAEGKTTYRVDANLFSSGMYVLQILNQQIQYSNKVIVR